MSSTELNQAIELDGRYVMQTYGARDRMFVRGEGAHLFDDAGR